MPTQLNPLPISADLLYAVKTDGPTDRRRASLATLERDRLKTALTSHRHRLSFWLNCYNAYVQLLEEEDPAAAAGGRIDQWRFFRRKRVPVAGAWLSLADIEHGMLRRSLSWGFGYLPRLFPSPFERQFRLEESDPRIHFALSRGRETSPPVTVYSPIDCTTELDIATEWYLEANVRYEAETNTVSLPRLFFWYRGDFGGRSGILEFLRRYEVIPEDAAPSFEYTADTVVDCAELTPAQR